MICPRCKVQRHGAPGAFGDCNCSFVTPVSTPIEFIDGPIPVSPILPPTAANMTLRDWFAGMALQGMINYGPWSDEQDMKRIARCAHLQADAMMEERGKK